MSIAADPRLLIRAHAHVLPPSRYTLYELTKLDDVQFARALSERIIRPDMQRADVTRFRQGGWEPPPPPDEERDGARKGLSGTGYRLDLARGLSGARVMSPPPFSPPLHSATIAASQTNPDDRLPWTRTS